MVKRVLALFLVAPLILLSAEFSSSVNRKEVGLGESVTLMLTLSEASPKGHPMLEPLKQSFYIHSQQQAQNTTIINGQMTSNMHWKIVLIPQKEGELVIPPIVIDTTEGLLSSKALSVQVFKGVPAATSSTPEAPPVMLAVEVSNAQPYKNEPVIYTIKLFSKHNLANVKLEKLAVEDAMIEPNGEAKIYQKVIAGATTNVIEISYLITPLKAGNLKIPSTTVQGGIPVRNRSSLFDNDLSLFAMMQGFDHLKPFALATEELILPVQAPLAGIQPWLPAKSFRIDEFWDESQTLQVGAPLTRSFEISANGLKSSQLPSLSDLQIDNQLCKIYADQPDLGEEVQEGAIQSYRTEQYTLIPQQAGPLTLPEITVSWWDVTQKEKKIARVAARTLQILPVASIADRELALAEEDAPSAKEGQTPVVQRDPLLYALIGGLGVFLLIALFWVVSLQRKIARMTENPSIPKPEPKMEPPVQAKKAIVRPPKKPKLVADKSEKLPNLNPT